MKVLSLFDGISCGMVALERAGIQVDHYVAYEIDKYAVQISEKNYPKIKHRGDVLEGNFKRYKGCDLLIGGSPCTYWSIAKREREVTPDGIGGQLFMQYVRALKESGAKYFLYENNYSIHKDIKAFISEQLGVEPIMINSALVSAQQRKRCYWTNIPGVTQPTDRGILLQDILESGIPWQDKSYCMTSSYDGAVFWNTLERSQRSMVAEPIPINPTKDGKSHALTATYYKAGENPCSSYGSERDKPRVAIPINTTVDGKARTIKAQYQRNSDANFFRTGFGATAVAMQIPEATKKGYTEIEPGECVDLTQPNSKTRRGRRMKDKCNCLTTSPQYYQYIAPVRVGHIGKSDGQANRVYSVRGKSVCLQSQAGFGGAKTGLYKIDLPDGDYIIRKLTPVEAERLQTLPDNYTEGISNSQRYKCIGNGWTVDVIAHILSFLPEEYKVN